jgi:hypothetical protein
VPRLEQEFVNINEPSASADLVDLSVDQRPPLQMPNKCLGNNFAESDSNSDKATSDNINVKRSPLDRSFSHSDISTSDNMHDPYCPPIASKEHLVVPHSVEHLLDSNLFNPPDLFDFYEMDDFMWSGCVFHLSPRD